MLQNTYGGDGTRLARVASPPLGSTTTTHYVGPWYEDDPVAHVGTAYYPFNGVPVAMKRGSTTTFLHHDHLGNLAAWSSASGVQQGWQRYGPYGTARLGNGTVPTDRLFTGQTSDAVGGSTSSRAGPTTRVSEGSCSPTPSCPTTRIHRSNVGLSTGHQPVRSALDAQSL